MYPEAEKYALQALEMRKECVPVKHYDVAYSLWLLGAIYIDWGRYKDAGLYLGKAANVAKSIHINYTTLLTLQALAEWQALVKNKCEAEKNLKKALEMIERVIGPDHSCSKAYAIYRCARCWMALNRYQEAEECLNKAKDVLGDVSEDNYVLLKVNLLQGQCLVAQQRFSEAQCLLVKVQNVLDLDSLKSGHFPQRGETLHYLGICLKGQKKNKAAEPLLSEALKLRKAVLGEHDKRTVDTCYVLKHCLESLGKQKEAGKILELSVFIESHSKFEELNYSSMADSHASAEPALQSSVQVGWQTATSFLCGSATVLAILIGIIFAVFV
jgi:tetratricopeptide (TPR) repeat protein